jgi:hypothetical protein
MALHLHRAERTDLLADGLGALLADPLPDPFAEELVLVPARGVERWLSQRLSHVLGRGRASDGVCAGVAFRSPGSLIAEITGTVDDDPWSTLRQTEESFVIVHQPAVETQSSTRRSLLIPVDFNSARDSWARWGQQAFNPPFTFSSDRIQFCSRS